MSLDKNKIDQKGENVSKFPRLINNQNGNWFLTLVYSQVFSSFYQQVNAATVQFRKFGMVPVSSLFLVVWCTFWGSRIFCRIHQNYLVALNKFLCLCVYIVLYNVKIYMCYVIALSMWNVSKTNFHLDNKIEIEIENWKLKLKLKLKFVLFYSIFF